MNCREKYVIDFNLKKKSRKNLSNGGRPSHSSSLNHRNDEAGVEMHEGKLVLGVRPIAISLERRGRCEEGSTHGGYTLRAALKSEKRKNTIFKSVYKMRIQLSAATGTPPCPYSSTPLDVTSSPMASSRRCWNGGRLQRACRRRVF